MSVNKETTAERVYKVRTALEKSQEAFGEVLGVKKATISRIEKGERSLTEQMAKSICREYNVDYFWLTEGFGEMFTNFPETILDEIVDEYHLDENDKLFLKAYLDTPENEKKAVMNFLLSIAENLQKKDEK